MLEVLDVKERHGMGYTMTLKETMRVEVGSYPKDSEFRFQDMNTLSYFPKTKLIRIGKESDTGGAHYPLKHIKSKPYTDEYLMDVINTAIISYEVDKKL